MNARSTVLRCVSLLHAWGLVGIPLCRPDGESGVCSALWHERPCTRAGKRPLLSAYARFAESKPELEAVMFNIARHARCNLGIVTGTVVVIEADSPDGEHEVEDLAGSALEHAPTRERRPGRGRAWLFTYDEPLANRAHLGASGAIDVRAAGGILVVPPSVHVTGHEYEWVKGRAPWEVAAPSLPLPQALKSLVAVSTTSATMPRIARESDASREIPARVRFLLRSNLGLTRLWSGEGKHDGDTSASGFDFAIARELLRLGIGSSEICAALVARPGAHRSDLSYAALTVENARRRR